MPLAVVRWQIMIPSTRPSRRGNRPGAFEVSFGIEDEDPDDSATTSASDASRKRDRGDGGDADLRVRAGPSNQSH